jgi:alpha-galactosidase
MFQLDPIRLFDLPATVSCRPAAVALRPTIDEDGALTITLHNNGDAPARVDEVALRFEPHRPARKYRQLIHRRTFEGLPGVKRVCEAAHWSPKVDDDSDMFTIYAHDDGDALLLGALPPYGEAFTTIRTVHAAGHMEGDFGFEIAFDLQRTIAPGDTATLPPIIATRGSDGVALLREYAQLTRHRNGRALKPTQAGWNSWDYYAGSITRAQMDENVAACRTRFGDKLQCMVIDEGYECQWGVWNAGWKFTEGLADYCKHVRDAGYVPGIWTAPLHVNTQTPLYREHPDWFASNADGNVFQQLLGYGMMAILDITHPQVQQHLRDVFARLHGDGFRYFKCDFTQQSLNAHRRVRDDLGRADLIRQTFAIIRETIGDDSYLLACGAPFESIIGIADATRISGDIAPFWGNIMQNIRAFMVRGWMQGAAGNADPDFAIIRTNETSNDPHRTPRMPAQPARLGVRWKDGPLMSLDEAMAYNLAVYLTGGEMILGDAIAKLNDRGINLLDKLLPPTGVPATCVNLFGRDAMIAPVFAADLGDKQLLGLFNLTDDPYTHPMRDEWQAPTTDFWTGDAVELNDTLTLPPRSARGLWLTR